MKLSKTIEKFISLFLIMNFVIVQNIQAAVLTGFTDTQRTLTVSTDMIKSSEPSDLPVAGISEYFDKEHIFLLKNFDLSSYIGKKVFIGYGIHDIDQKNCKFLNVPGKTELNFNSVFREFKKYSEHSYGISMTRMSYSECQTLATEYGGVPMIMDSIAEANWVAAKFIDSKIIEDAWFGAKKTTCADPLYTNELQKPQHTEFWNNSGDGATCDPRELNLVMDFYKKWRKVPAAINSYCIVEFASKDMFKPLKICAPWWKVIREYPNRTPGLYDPEKLKRINQADIPKQIPICSAYETNAVNQAVSQPPRIVHCTEYYSKEIAPECLLIPEQPICKVDECGGYIKNACRLKGQVEAGKEYVKGEVIVDGAIEEGKNKINVITKEYECPASKISEEFCLEWSTVLVYPQECPNSNCIGLKECVLSIDSKDRTGYDTCVANFPCIKIYGGRDIPPDIDTATGKVSALYGKCPDAPISDGSNLRFEVNVQNKLAKKCIEYEETNTTLDITQKCTLEKPYQDYSISTSLTEIDAYQDNPACLRIDSVQDTLAMNQVIFGMTAEGYLKGKMNRVFLDGSVEVIADDGDDSYVISGAIPAIPDQPLEEANPTIKTTTYDLDATAGCDPTYTITDNTSNAGEWYDRNQNVFYQNPDNSTMSIDPNVLDTIIVNDSGIAEVRISDSVIDSESDCSLYAEENGFTSEAYRYTFNLVTNVDTCILELTEKTLDSKVSESKRISLGTRQYKFKDTMSGNDCMKKAWCFSATYNESSFATDSTVGECIVTTAEGGAPNAYKDKLLAEAGYVPEISNQLLGATEEDCTPNEAARVNYSTEIDGVENIFVYEEYVRGGWGNYSNYNSWPAKSNKIVVSNNDMTDTIIPIIGLDPIRDRISYHGLGHHESSKAKEPDYEATAITGVVVLATMATTYVVGVAAALLLGSGLGATVALSVFGPVGWILAAIVVIVAFLLTAITSDYDRQNTETHIYKDIPLEFYYRGIYDSRFLPAESHIAGEESNPDSPAGFQRITYMHTISKTGRLEPSEFNDMLAEYYDSKQMALVCSGFTASELSNLTLADELSIRYGYPKCPIWNPFCTKTDWHKTEGVTRLSDADSVYIVPVVPLATAEAHKLEKDTARVTKSMVNLYLNATNTLIVIVPKKGDYKLTAYNKYDTKLAEQIIHESSLQNPGGGPNSLKWARVMFGMTMNISSGEGNFPLSEGTVNNACRQDNSVEWGGGVSGIYFENQRTAINKGCQKSNAPYLKDQAMTKLTVQPLNIDRAFEFELTYPMAYANRIILVSFEELEDRKYRCFGDFGSCQDEDFIEGGE